MPVRNLNYRRQRACLAAAATNSKFILSTELATNIIQARASALMTSYAAIGYI